MTRGGHPTVHTGRRYDASCQREHLCDECGAPPGEPCRESPHGYVHAARRSRGSGTWAVP